MRITLLQEERYLPSYNGGNKSSRRLLEALARHGHECLVLCSACPRTTPLQVFREEMARRGIPVREPAPGRFEYQHAGVRVAGMPPAGLDERREFLLAAIQRCRPDVVVVSADPRYYLLESALRAAPGRVVFVVHSHEHVPFGPFSRRTDSRQMDLLRGTDAVVAVSHYSQAFLREHGGLDAVLLRFPVYGDGPFTRLGRPDRGCVTLINGSVEKGVDLFMELAGSFPRRDFAVVRWWLADRTLAALVRFPNVRLLEPADEIDEILRRTKVLLMPSLLPETFGLSAVEAMLRGIPVLASDLGGLPEATLGVAPLLPVRPVEVRDGEFVAPPQEAGPWREALGRLLDDPSSYERSAAESRHAASRFVAPIDHRPFEDLFRRIASRHGPVSPGDGRPIGVVDPYDAAFLLAEELQRRGHPCVGIDSSEHVDAEIRAKCRPERMHAIVRHRGDVGATRAELRRLGVDSVLHGCETGVTLADRLCEAMDFCPNGTVLSEARRDKWLMAAAARRCGIRVPDQCCSGDLGELLAWARQRGRWPVVAKPPHSLASEGVHVCRTEPELEQAFGRLFQHRNISGLVNHAVLVQELIYGDQYVLDTVTRDGEHYLAGVWAYGRPEFADDVIRSARGAGDWPASLSHVSWDEINYAAVGSNSKRILPGEGELAEALFSYATRVLDALAIRHGPAHFEIMWVDGEPLLVEVGARLHGAPSTHWMCRICTGTSQMDLTIDAFLNPAHFLRTARRDYRLRWHGYNYRLHPWRAGSFRGFHGLDRIERLPSFQSFFYMSPPKTIVFKDCLGVVALIHPDDEVIRRDCQSILELERQDLFDLGAPADDRPRYS